MKEVSGRDSVEIAIVGAGVVGLATALRLAAEGREVVLIDPKEPGSGASYGNAGTFADYACVPVGNPDVLKNLPQLLLNPDSPFALRWAALFQLAPWLVRFVHQSLPMAARKNAVALAEILAEALPAWEELAVEAGVEGLMRRNGCLYLQQDMKSSVASWAHTVRGDLGVHQEVLSAEEVVALEPMLPHFKGRGVFFPDSMNVIDPSALMRALLAAARSKGATTLKSRIDRIDPRDERVLLYGSGINLTARNVVVAAGAFSREFARQAGDRVPLETERGYHLEFSMESPLLQRPVCPTHLGFYMTSLAGRLRVAGTVELGGTQAGPSEARFALLERGVRHYFPDLKIPSSRWLGFRPSLPDSRPVIGRSSASREVIYAFGHGHLGLTLAAITGRLVAGMINRNEERLLSEFTARRFR